MDAKMTEAVFQKHLSQKPHHHHFIDVEDVENGDTLMNCLNQISSVRGRTHGIVISKLDCKNRKEVMRFLWEQQCSVQIDFCAKVSDGVLTYPYVHIKVHIKPYKH
jgi:hypothetical protein